MAILSLDNKVDQGQQIIINSSKLTDSDLFENILTNWIKLEPMGGGGGRGHSNFFVLGLLEIHLCFCAKLTFPGIESVL